MRNLPYFSLDLFPQESVSWLFYGPSCLFRVFLNPAWCSFCKLWSNHCVFSDRIRISSPAPPSKNKKTKTRWRRPYIMPLMNLRVQNGSPQTMCVISQQPRPPFIEQYILGNTQSFQNCVRQSHHGQKRDYHHCVVIELCMCLFLCTHTHTHTLVLALECARKLRQPDRNSLSWPCSLLAAGWVNASLWKPAAAGRSVLGTLSTPESKSPGHIGKPFKPSLIMINTPPPQHKIGLQTPSSITDMKPRPL